MKNFFQRGIAALTVLAGCYGMAYATPEATIGATWPQGPQTVDGVLFMIEVEWSNPVNVDNTIELNISDGVNGTTGFFVEDEKSEYTIIELNEELTVPGRYSVVIPEGTVFDGETLETSMACNERTVLVFVIEENVYDPDDYKFTIGRAEPADGSVVTSLKDINTYWDGPVDYSGVGEGMVQLYNEAGELLQKTDLMMTHEDFSLFEVHFDEEVTEPGNYTVVFPQGIMTYKGDPSSPEITLHYTIGEAEDDGSVKLLSTNPENGSTVTALDKILTVWSLDPTNPNYDSDKPEIEVADANGVKVAKGSLDIDMDSWDGDKLILQIDPIITTEGTYNIIIPEKSVFDETYKITNKPIVLNYTIAEQELTIDFQPTQYYPKVEEPVDANISDSADLSTINITFPSVPVIKEGYQFVFTNEDGEEFPSDKQMANSNFGEVLILGLEDIPSGKYTLNVPEGVIGDKAWAASGYVSGNCNKAFSVTWTYIAKKKVELPDWVLTDPLKMEAASLTIPGGENVNLLSGDVELADIPAGTVFNFLTNKNEYANSLRLTIEDNTTKEILWTVSTLVSKDKTIPSIGLKGDDGLFHFEKATTLTLYNNTTYTLTVEAYENYEVPESERIYLDKVEINIKGLSEPIVYSDVEIDDMEPDPETFVINSIEEGKFTIVYSEPVEIVTQPNANGICSGISVKNEGVYPYADLTPNEDKTEWTFTIPEEILNKATGEIICLVMANDMEGKRVYPDLYDYNSGAGDDACQMYIFTCYLGCPVVTVVPGEGVVNELYTFEFTCPDAVGHGIGFSGMGAHDVANATLYNADGEAVTKIDRNNFEDEDDGAVVEQTVIKLIMHLEEKVTEAGEYTLYIEPGFFITGSQFDSPTNRAQYIKYTVDPTGSVAAITEGGFAVEIAEDGIIVKGAEGTVTVYSVNGSKVVSATSVNGVANISLEKGVYVVTANGKSIKIAF